VYLLLFRFSFSDSESAQEENNSENRLLQLNENEKYRIVALIFDSDYFRTLGLELGFRETDLDYNLRPRKLHFRSGKYMDLRWNEYVISCRVYRRRGMSDEQSEKYYVGWGYNANENSVYLFRDENENEIHVFSFVKDI
jgi:hypothetical protein